MRCLFAFFLLCSFCAAALAAQVQAARDLTKCFTEVSGSEEVFNVMGSGRIVTQGEIGCRRVRIELDPNNIVWPDYVFQPDYDLMPLRELAQYVERNKRLPDMPSAKEVEGRGLDLGQMDAALLKKVEELTLYVIELQKQIDELKREQGR